MYLEKYVDIHFRVSPDEKKQITDTAKEAGISLSEYGRAVLLSATDYKKMDNNIDETHGEMKAEKASVKTVRFDMRVSPDEMMYYIQESDRAHCSVSEYVRRCANGNHIYVVEGLPELTKQIAKIGVNVNQLTMLAHQGKIKEVDLFPFNDTLKQILKELLKITKKKR